jgi:hypothetical protein
MIHAGIKPQGPDRQAPAENRSGQVDARMLCMWVAGSLETALEPGHFSPTIMDCEGADDCAASNGPNYFKSSARERPAELLSSLESIVRSLSGSAALKRFSMSARNSFFV